jgi:hypothetical protein
MPDDRKQHASETQFGDHDDLPYRPRQTPRQMMAELPDVGEVVTTKALYVRYDAEEKR